MGDLWSVHAPARSTPVAAIEGDDFLDQLPAVPLIAGSRQFWLANTLRFNSLGRGVRAVFLEHMSFRVYRGEELTAISKELLVRGEWDLRLTKESRQKGHPQPHWHVHGATTHEAHAFVSLHYAMASTWHTREPTVVVEDINSERIVGWASEIVKHLMEQLRYACNEPDFQRGGL